VCRLLNYMDAHGYRQCTPRRSDPDLTEEPIMSFTSGYVQRALPMLPSQGSKRPWKLYQNYLLDLMTMQFGAVNDGSMEFRAANPT
jgi:monooxygenase